MPTYVRWREAGATFFFTVVTYRRQRILTTPLARPLLRQAIAEVRDVLPFMMHAMVLLPDHLHCLWELPPADENFPERWRRIKNTFTRLYLAAGGRDWDVTAAAAHQRRRGIWQPRYWEHRIRDERDFIRHRDYIHLNPVIHDYVARPEDWPWSTFHQHVQRGELDPHWPGTSPVDLPAIDD